MTTYCRLREWSSTCAAIYQVSTCPPNCPILRTLLTCYLLWKVPSGTSARPLWSSTGPPSLTRWCMTSWAPSRWVSPLACGQLILCHAVSWLSLAFSQLTVFWVMQSADSLVIQVAYCILCHVISRLFLSCSQETVFSVIKSAYCILFNSNVFNAIQSLTFCHAVSWLSLSFGQLIVFSVMQLSYWNLYDVISWSFQTVIFQVCVVALGICKPAYRYLRPSYRPLRTTSKPAYLPLRTTEKPAYLPLRTTAKPTQLSSSNTIRRLSTLKPKR
jgi:hypothetical protein